IDSMTKEERRNPDIIDIGRRRRIAAGSGTEPHEIKQFINHFDQMRTLMRQLAKKSMWERLRMVTSLGKMGAFDPGSQMLKRKVGTGHRKSAKERAEDRKRKRKQERRKGKDKKDPNRGRDNGKDKNDPGRGDNPKPER